MYRKQRLGRRALLAALQGTLIASLVLGVTASSVLARGGKGGSGTGGGTVAVVMVTDANGNGAPNWGDSVTYRVATTATLYPYVATTCRQGKTLVLSTSAGFFPSYAWPDAQVVPLMSTRWTGGSASCTATLYSMDGGTQTILSTLSFAAGA